ncbi:hypothetical protein [Novosphingobium sp. CECT 9465]|uniref:hypothetical protein n=1 Tax=Novosphingobium sp. CECT 9465 TaxID=2829794 RepID=UPI001E54A6D2|nr:hypothetical protein [Novosphingobium sp. CECT 9465]
MLAALSGFAPTSESYAAVNIAMICALLVLVVLCNVWVFGQRLKARTARMVFAALTVVSLVLLGFYTIDLMQFQIVHGDQAIIGGCGWTDEAIAIANDMKRSAADQCPGDVEWLLEQAALPKEIWKRAALQANEVRLLALWAGLTLAWSALVAFFALAFLKPARAGLSLTVRLLTTRGIASIDTQRPRFEQGFPMRRGRPRKEAIGQFI